MMIWLIMKLLKFFFFLKGLSVFVCDGNNEIVFSIVILYVKCNSKILI